MVQSISNCGPLSYVGGSGFEFRAKETPLFPSTFALEAEEEMEILEVLRGLEVAIILGDANPWMVPSSTVHFSLPISVQP